MSAEWKVKFAICIAPVAIQAFTKLLFSFSNVLKATNCTFQVIDNIFWTSLYLITYRLLFDGYKSYPVFFWNIISEYDEFFSCMCAFARHTSSRITFLTLTIVGRLRGDIFQTFGESWHLPSIFLQWSVSKMWFETMYDVQKHPMHTKIQQHTYRRRIHHILIWYSKRKLDNLYNHQIIVYR
jgi:hypothetical protein